MRPAWVWVMLVGCGGLPVGIEAAGTTTSGTTTSATKTATATTSTTDSTPTSGSETGTSTGGDDSSTGEQCVDGSERPCFDGPPGSEPVAPCKRGIQVCDFLGDWGPCFGDVLPELQDCATAQDETCSGAGPTCAGGQKWLRASSITADTRWGGAIGASALAIAADGDIVATGTYQGTLQFGADLHTSGGDADIWVARFAPDGAPKWFRRFGEELDPWAGYSGAPWSAGNIAFAANGDILVTSNCVEAIDFGFGPLTGEEHDPVALRMTAGGQVKWAHRYVGLAGSEGIDYPMYIAPAANDRVWLVGTLYGGSADLGGAVLYSAGWGDVVLAQLDAAGEHLWSRRAGDTGHQQVGAIATAAGGGLVITGSVEGTLDLGGGPLVSAGKSDTWLALLDPDGAQVWARRDGDNFNQSGARLHVDGTGGILLAGHFESTIDLGGGSLGPPPGHTWSRAIFLAKFAPGGTHLWSTALGHDDDDLWASSLALGPDGTIVLGGQGPLHEVFTGDVWDVGDGSWIATLDATGTPRWLHDLGSSTRAVVASDGSVIASFDIYDMAQFAGVTVGAPGVASLVLGNYGP